MSRAYDKGQLQALTAVEAASVAEQDMPALVKKFASLDVAEMSTTMRHRYAELSEALRKRGYLP